MQICGKHNTPKITKLSQLDLIIENFREQYFEQFFVEIFSNFERSLINLYSEPLQTVRT